MKVQIGNEVFLVHWTKRFSHAQYEKRNDRLVKTTCFIRKVRENADPVLISSTSVLPKYGEQANGVLARKFSFAKTMDGVFSKPERTLFWEEFKRTSRFSPANLRSKNRKLKEKIKKLENKIAEIKKIQEQKIMT